MITKNDTIQDDLGAVSKRFAMFLDRLQGAPSSASERVAWLAALFDTHRNTPRGWVFDNKVPHKFEQIIASLVEQYGTNNMNTAQWVNWIKWGGREPAPLESPPTSLQSIDHDFKRDLYLSVDAIARSKGVHIESLSKQKRWRLYDLIIMYTEAKGNHEIDEVFVEGLLDLLV